MEMQAQQLLLLLLLGRPLDSWLRLVQLQTLLQKVSAVAAALPEQCQCWWWSTQNCRQHLWT
jgi:hypothetical protein